MKNIEYYTNYIQKDIYLEEMLGETAPDICHDYLIVRLKRFMY